MSIDELVDLGAKGSELDNAPSPENMAVIMYTSGSTGKPKVQSPLPLLLPLPPVPILPSGLTTKYLRQWGSGLWPPRAWVLAAWVGGCPPTLYNSRDGTHHVTTSQYPDTVPALGGYAAPEPGRIFNRCPLQHGRRAEAYGGERDISGLPASCAHPRAGGRGAYTPLPISVFLAVAPRVPPTLTGLMLLVPMAVTGGGGKLADSLKPIGLARNHPFPPTSQTPNPEQRGWPT